MMDVRRYVERIGFEGALTENLDCLMNLHRCHVMSIPFEALDVQYGNEIVLDLDHLFEKVIEGRRGGYCYELNYLFNSLLTEIGFNSKIVSASIYDDGVIGPEFDHMAIVVQLDDLYLVDVGYGDLFIEPLCIRENVVQEDQFKLYQMKAATTDHLVLKESLKSNVQWVDRYQFSTKPRTVRDFEEQNNFKQNSPLSYFVENRICTIATPHGRKSIVNDTYKVKEGSEVTVRDIANQEDLNRILKADFGFRS